MIRCLSFMCIAFSACSATVIHTSNHSVVCYRDARLVLNAPIDPSYRLVFTGSRYELHLVDSHRRVAVFDTCQIEIFSTPASTSPTR